MDVDVWVVVVEAGPWNYFLNVCLKLRCAKGTRSSINSDESNAPMDASVARAFEVGRDLLLGNHECVYTCSTINKSV